MPEGDTVWRAAERLRQALDGQKLVATDFRVPQHATVDLSGLAVESVASRGKHLLIRVGGRTIHTHLKMEGAWHVHRLGAPWRRPEHAARLVLQTSTHEAVGFSLGITDVLPTAHEHQAVGHLGPDLLGDPAAEGGWDLDEAVRRAGSDPDRPVFLALLDQRNLAGLGNEYVNELLFVSGLAPTRPVGQVRDLRRVIATGHKMLDVNKDRVERTFTGNTRSGQERWVYARERARCRRCHTRIATGSLGDRPTTERNTFWCPSCQPAP